MNPLRHLHSGNLELKVPSVAGLIFACVTPHNGRLCPYVGLRYFTFLCFDYFVFFALYDVLFHLSRFKTFICHLKCSGIYIRGLLVQWSEWTRKTYTIGIVFRVIMWINWLLTSFNLTCYVVMFVSVISRYMLPGILQKSRSTTKCLTWDPKFDFQRL